MQVRRFNHSLDPGSKRCVGRETEIGCTGTTISKPIGSVKTGSLGLSFRTIDHLVESIASSHLMMGTRTSQEGSLSSRALVVGYLTDRHDQLVQVSTQLAVYRKNNICYRDRHRVTENSTVDPLL
jgi:hypothetical protein